MVINLRAVSTNKTIIGFNRSVADLFRLARNWLCIYKDVIIEEFCGFAIFVNIQ